MAYRKEIIVLSGGRQKGVVKLQSGLNSNAKLKGSCTVDFIPQNAKLYIMGDTISELPLYQCDTAFEIPDCGGSSVSCVIISQMPALVGSTKGGEDKTKIIAKAEAYKKAKEEKLNAKVSPKSENEKPIETIPEIDVGIKEVEKVSDAYAQNSIKRTEKTKKSDVAADVSAMSPLTAQPFGEGVRYDGTNFYHAIKPQLDEMFICYPDEDRLNAIVPNSKWVRVDAEEDYYVVGLLFDLESPAFICYGIPSLFSNRPPSDIADMCVWLPLDADKPDADGYWIIYQSAVNGAIVK